MQTIDSSAEAMPSTAQQHPREPREEKSREQKHSQARNIIAFSALIMVMFCVVVAYQASRAYEQAVREGEADAARLSQSLSSHVELSFLSVDLTLRRAVERHYFNDLFGGNLPKDVENNFRMWVHDTPQISSLFLTNAQGEVVIYASSEAYAGLFSPGSSVAFQPFFKLAKEGTGDELLINTFEARQGAAPLIVLSRSFHHINGEFGGVIVAFLNPNYFVEFFRSVDEGNKSFMTMLKPTGELLVTGAYDKAEQDAIDKRVLETFKQRDPTAITVDKITLDNAIKIYAYRQLNILPVVVVAVTDEEDFLFDWSNDRVKDVGFLSMFAIFGSVLSYFALTMVKQIRRVEESEQAAIMASQAKSEFLANMSHELRTPLNAIIGFSEMMDAGYFGGLTPKQKERIHDIHLCGNHLLQLINDILEFSKGEAGKMELHDENFHLAEIVDECERIVSPRAKVKEIEVETHTPKNLPLFRGDKRKIRQLLLNLLSNAVKFTEDRGKISVNIRMTPQRLLIMEVVDNGIGMREEDIPIALSVFGQVHRMSHPEGTGLGLPLCRMFAELHGGELDMKSKPGKGTAVTVIFPPERLVSAE